MLIFVSGHHPIYGKQMLYFFDPILRSRAEIPPPTKFYSIHDGVLSPQRPTPEPALPSKPTSGPRPHCRLPASSRRLCHRPANQATSTTPRFCASAIPWFVGTLGFEFGAISNAGESLSTRWLSRSETHVALFALLHASRECPAWTDLSVSRARRIPAEHTNWFSLVFYGDLAILATELEKGTNLYVDGTFDQRPFVGQDKYTRYVYEVTVQKFFVVGGAAQDSPVPPKPHATLTERGHDRWRSVYRIL